MVLFYYISLVFFYTLHVNRLHVIYFLSHVNPNWRSPFNRLRNEPIRHFSRSRRHHSWNACRSFVFRSSPLPPFFSQGSWPAFLHYSLLQVRSRNKRKRNDRDSIPRPLEWQSSALTTRPRHSPVPLQSLISPDQFWGPFSDINAIISRGGLSLYNYVLKFLIKI